MIVKSALLTALFISLCVATTSAQANQSIYTDTAGKICRTLSYDKQSGSISQQCPGVGGYKLIVDEGDLRQNVTVITPGGAKHSLDLWNIISPHFSSVGAKAEWRVRRTGGKVIPIALIVRFNVNDDAENPTKSTSYLVVAKITAKEVCITDKISPDARANEEARRAADSAFNKSCLKSP